MPDQDGYPTDEELERLKSWDGLGNPHGLISFLEEIWHWPDWGIEKKESKTVSKKRCVRLYLHTGGWSGNEEIIRVLQESWFWHIFWLNSHRGGHYEFEIPSDWGKNGL